MKKRDNNDVWETGVKNHRLLTNIYMLVDPREPEIARYIGKADWLAKRLINHIHEAHKNVKCTNTHKNKWIRSLLKDGIEPKIILLAIVKKSICAQAETGYIKLFKSLGAKLVNGTEIGGQGGPLRRGMSRTPEAIEKHKNTIRQNGGHPNKGKPISEEHKKKLREAHLGKKLSEQHKKAIGLGITGERNPNFQGRAVSDFQREVARQTILNHCLKSDGHKAYVDSLRTKN